MISPTTSQVALALDILAHLPLQPDRQVPAITVSGGLSPTATLLDPRDGLLRQAARVVESAFDLPGWTGKVEGKCGEYGKPPVSTDPEAQDAVLKLQAVTARTPLSGCFGEITHEHAIHMLAEIREILDS